MLLRDAGYRTGFIGKWGLGGDLPKSQFDFFEGFSGQGQYFHEIHGEKMHLTRLMAQNAMRFIRGCSSDQPFCLSVSFKAPHVKDGDPNPFQYDPDFEELYQEAQSVLNPRKLTEYAEAGGVGAAILAESGKVYTGVCVDTSSSMGFCAEHAAASAMITAGESRVLKMIAVNWDERVIPPCGRCREFVSQLHEENRSTEVMIGEGEIKTIRELLPYDWRQSVDSES